jgi:hypothetical protein
MTAAKKTPYKHKKILQEEDNKADTINHNVFPQADKIKLIRKLVIFFKFNKITASEKIVTLINKGILIGREEKICKGINFWIIKINIKSLYGLINKIDKSQLWNGGTPSLNRIEEAKIKETIKGAQFRAPKAEKIKKIDAILCEIKYFKLISDEKKDDLALIRGKTEIILSSRLNHRKKIVCEDSAHTKLTSNKLEKPIKGVKNIIRR